MEVQPKKQGSMWVNSLLAVTVLLAAFTLLVTLTFKHLVAPSDLAVYSKSDLGTFGDFLGGILNPILSSLTIVLLIWSIRVQLNELKISREQHTLAIDQSKEALNQLISTQEREKSMVNAQRLNLVLPRASEELSKQINELHEIKNKKVQLFFEKQDTKLRLRIVECTYSELLFRTKYLISIQKPFSLSKHSTNVAFKFILEIQSHIHRASFMVDEMQKLSSPPFLYAQELRILFNYTNQLKVFAEETENMKFLDRTVKRIEGLRTKAKLLDEDALV